MMCSVCESRQWPSFSMGIRRCCTDLTQPRITGAKLADFQYLDASVFNLVVFRFGALRLTREGLALWALVKLQRLPRSVRAFPSRKIIFMLTYIIFSLRTTRVIEENALKVAFDKRIVI